MNKRYLILYILLFAYSFNLSAQKSYNLSECKEIAIKNNRTIKNSNLNINSALETQKEAFTNYFPTVSATGFGFKANNNFISMNLGGMPLGLLDDGLTGAVSLTQPLFVGGKIINANKISKLGVEVNKQQARMSANEVLLQVENSYWGLLGLYEKMNTLDTLHKQLISLLNDVEISYKAGLITNNDVLQVKLKLNEVKSNKVNLENGISLSKMSLCQLLGLDISTSEQFDIERPDIKKTESPIVFYINHIEALGNRAENILLEKNVDASKLQTRIKRADYLPTMAVGAAYMQENFMDKWNGNSVVFVTVNIPISGWWGGSHAIKKQRINEEIANNNKIDGQEQLLLQMQSVKNDLDNAYKQIQIAKESIEQSEENLRLNNNFFKAGTVSLTDVFDAQSLMQQSRDKYVDAYSLYQKKLFEYLQVTGR